MRKMYVQNVTIFIHIQVTMYNVRGLSPSLQPSFIASFCSVFWFVAYFLSGSISVLIKSIYTTDTVRNKLVKKMEHLAAKKQQTINRNKNTV